MASREQNETRKKMVVREIDPTKFMPSRVDISPGFASVGGQDLSKSSGCHFVEQNQKCAHYLLQFCCNSNELLCVCANPRHHLQGSLQCHADSQLPQVACNLVLSTVLQVQPNFQAILQINCVSGRIKKNAKAKPTGCQKNHGEGFQKHNGKMGKADVRTLG